MDQDQRLLLRIRNKDHSHGLESLILLRIRVKNQVEQLGKSIMINDQDQQIVVYQSQAS